MDTFYLPSATFGIWQVWSLFIVSESEGETERYWVKFDMGRNALDF